MEEVLALAPAAAHVENLRCLASDRRDRADGLFAFRGAHEDVVEFRKVRRFEQQSALVGRQALEDFVCKPAECVAAGAAGSAAIR